MMTFADSAIEHYRSLDTKMFTELERLEVHQPIPFSDETSNLSLEIVLRSGHGSGDPKLHLSFQGVTELRLSTGAYVQLMRIEVISIRDRQWQDLHYLVHESEEDSLYFYCNTFDAKVVADRTLQI